MTKPASMSINVSLVFLTAGHKATMNLLPGPEGVFYKQPVGGVVGGFSMRKNRDNVRFMSQ